MDGRDHGQRRGDVDGDVGDDVPRSASTGAFAVPSGWRALSLVDPAVAAAGGWSVWRVAETGSTNVDLLALAETAPHHTVLVTDHQTAGRGRLDRRWDAPPGTNLLSSILFRVVPEQPHELTLRVGIAAVDAVLAVAAVEARLKWPNDVLLDGRKLAGILAHRHPDGPVVVGIGLNVRWAPDDAALLGAAYTPDAVLTELLRSLASPPADIHARYRGLLDTLGRRIRVDLPDGEITGTAVDVERDGRLVVVDDCALTHRVDTGDIVHLRTV